MTSKIVVVVFGVVLAGTVGALALFAGRPQAAPIAVKAIALEALPDREAVGARVLAQHCDHCHALPDPASHRADEWPLVVQRMTRHAHSGMQHHGPMWTAEETRALLAYLAAHAAGAPAR